MYPKTLKPLNPELRHFYTCARLRSYTSVLKHVQLASVKRCSIDPRHRQEAHELAMIIGDILHDLIQVSPGPPQALPGPSPGPPQALPLYQLTITLCDHHVMFLFLSAGLGLAVSSTPAGCGPGSYDPEASPFQHHHQGAAGAAVDFSRTTDRQGLRPDQWPLAAAAAAAVRGLACGAGDHAAGNTSNAAAGGAGGVGDGGAYGVGQQIPTAAAAATGELDASAAVGPGLDAAGSKKGVREGVSSKLVARWHQRLREKQRRQHEGDRLVLNPSMALVRPSVRVPCIQPLPSTKAVDQQGDVVQQWQQRLATAAAAAAGSSLVSLPALAGVAALDSGIAGGDALLAAVKPLPPRAPAFALMTGRELRPVGVTSYYPGDTAVTQGLLEYRVENVPLTVLAEHRKAAGAPSFQLNTCRDGFAPGNCGPAGKGGVGAAAGESDGGGGFLHGVQQQPKGGGLEERYKMAVGLGHDEAAVLLDQTRGRAGGFGGGGLDMGKQVGRGGFVGLDGDGGLVIGGAYHAELAAWRSYQPKWKVNRPRVGETGQLVFSLQQAAAAAGVLGGGKLEGPDQW